MDIREKIIQSSTELFLANGLKSITMDDVATHLGISKRTIYENFANKKELLEACVESIIQAHDELENEIREKSENVIEEIFWAFNDIDENYSQRGRLTRDIQKYYPDIYETKISNRYEASREKLLETLSRGVEQGIISPDTNLDFAVFIVMETLYNVLSHPETLISKKVSFVDALKYVIIHFFRGVSTEKGIAIMDTYIKNGVQDKKQ